MDKDFITRYVDLQKGITDAPEEFQEATALFLLSTAAGRNFIFLSLPETCIFSNGLDVKDVRGKFLNLWFILIGKTRVTRKTTGVINRAEEIIDFLKINKILHGFSTSYLISHLNDMKEGMQVHATWISDECSGFWDLLKAKTDYMLEADAILSTIYDCKTYSKGTQARGKEYVPNPYLTVLLASTDYLPHLFTEAMLRQGFLNRFIFVVAKRSRKMALRTTSLTPEEKETVEYVLQYLKALLNRGTPITMVMHSKANDLYVKFEDYIDNWIEKGNLGLKEGYLGNLPNFVIRLACLYRLSRMTIEEIQNYKRPFLEVEEEDMKRAIDYSKKIWNWFGTTMQIRSAETVAEPVYTLEKYEAVIRKVYAEAGREELPQNYLRKKTSIPSKKLVEVLQDMGCKMRIVKSTSGRSAIMWKLL